MRRAYGRREYKIVDGKPIRKCEHCKKWFSPDCFYKRKRSPDGLRAECKFCVAKVTKKYHENNKEIISKRVRAYYEKNKEIINSYKSKWQRENSEKRRLRLNERYRTEPNFKIAVNLRTRVLKAIGNNQKSGSTLEILGCSIEYFKNYIASMFTPEMSWENHGKVWHIDHKRPCVSFDLSKPEQQRVCFHYKNMQPLLVKDNLQKGSRYLWT